MWAYLRELVSIVFGIAWEAWALPAAIYALILFLIMWQRLTIRELLVNCGHSIRAWATNGIHAILYTVLVLMFIVAPYQLTQSLKTEVSQQFEMTKAQANTIETFRAQIELERKRNDRLVDFTSKPNVAVSAVDSGNDRQGRKITVLVQYKNSGMSSANEVTAHRYFTIGDDGRIPSISSPTLPAVIHQNVQKQFAPAVIGEPYYSEINSGKKLLQMWVTIRYSGLEGRRYIYEASSMYDPRQNVFIILRESDRPDQEGTKS